MYCTSCGSENPKGFKFCSQCGRAQSSGNSTVESDDLFENSESLTPPSAFSRLFSTYSNLKFPYKVGASVAIVLSIVLIFYVSAGVTTLLTKNSSTADSEIISTSDSMVDDGASVSDEPAYSSGASDVASDPGSYVWQHNLDMAGPGTWVERAPSEWKENVNQQYLFVNQVGCLFYVFDENADDPDVMNRAYQWLAQYSGVHIAGSNWLLMDQSYNERCTGPVTDTFGGYRVN